MLKEIDRPPTVRETVASALREAIWRGDLKPGQPLLEADLSRSLKVARGTLREAFRVLQRERLVEEFPHRGVFVATLSSRKIEELYSLRELLEPFAVGLAIKNEAYGEPELLKIEQALQQLGEAEQRGDEFEMTRADVDFHRLICAPSNHELLLDILRNMQSLSTLCIIASYRTVNPPELRQEREHRQILNAIRSGEQNRGVRQTLRDSNENENGFSGVLPPEPPGLRRYLSHHCRVRSSLLPTY